MMRPLIFLLICTFAHGTSTEYTWVKSSGKNLRICAGVERQCKAMPSCTIIAHGPCGSVSGDVPPHYFKSEIDSIGLIKGSTSGAYLSDPKLVTRLSPSTIANNGYRQVQANQTQGAAEYAMVTNGAFFGDPAVMGAFLGTNYMLIQQGSMSTNTLPILMGFPGSPEMGESLACISNEVVNASCGPARAFTSGNLKFSIYGITIGSKYELDPSVKYLAFRQVLSTVDFPDYKIYFNSGAFDMTNVSTNDVHDIEFQESALNGGSIRMDFPGNYIVGDIQLDSGMTTARAVRNVTIKASSGSSPRTINLDYLFSVDTDLNAKGKFFMYDPTVTELRSWKPKSQTYLALDSARKASIGISFVAVVALAAAQIRG
eukprot:TRINITY_DN29452_c0_g1_i1.p1 TRINITY_DN29452_c0_g1~~TRINITY_DN29452_c0_g1_i1.p1  ORF type:complete len:372 (-),score=27.39 TRINITY_DN29452_c0_g1_i1:97-1212(-)